MRELTWIPERSIWAMRRLSMTSNMRNTKAATSIAVAKISRTKIAVRYPASVSENAVPDWARISSSLISACEVRSSFSTKIRSTRALNALPSGKVRNSTIPASSSRPTITLIPMATIRVPERRASVAEEVRSGTVFPFGKPRFVEDRHHIEQRPASLFKPRLQLLPCGCRGAGLGDLGHAVMQAQRRILFRLVIGVTRGLRRGGQGQHGADQKGDNVFHGVKLRRRSRKYNNAAAAIG